MLGFEVGVKILPGKSKVSAHSAERKFSSLYEPVNAGLRDPQKLRHLLNREERWTSAAIVSLDRHKD
jgi:hypothetical protein